MNTEEARRLAAEAPRHQLAPVVLELCSEVERLRKTPCIDCGGIGRCQCGDCKGETCLLCSGTGYAPLTTNEDLAAEILRLRAEAAAMREAIAALPAAYPGQTGWSSARLAMSDAIAVARRAAGLEEP